MSNIREVRFLTDDRDNGSEEKNELVIMWGENSDWYVAVVPEGEKAIGKGVRISTSGGASTAVPGLTRAISDAFHAIAKAREGNGVKHERY